MLTEETSRLRVGIVGAGNISGVHLRALAQLGNIDVHVTAICDLEQNKARNKAETFGIPTVFPDAETLIASDQVDIVLIATPPGEHARLTLLALAAGKHVVCEKPMAMDVAECDAMIAAAEASAGSLFVVQNRLYTAAMRKAREMIRAGELGEVIHVLTEGYEGEELAARMPSITTDTDGVIRTQMMHQTYVVPGLLGREITSVNVRSNNLGSVPMVASDVTATAIFTYDDGTIQTSIGTFGLSDGRITWRSTAPRAICARPGSAAGATGGKSSSTAREASRIGPMPSWTTQRSSGRSSPKCGGRTCTASEPGKLRRQPSTRHTIPWSSWTRCTSRRPGTGNRLPCRGDRSLQLPGSPTS